MRLSGAFDTAAESVFLAWSFIGFAVGAAGNCAAGNFGTSADCIGSDAGFESAAVVSSDVAGIDGGFLVVAIYAAARISAEGIVEAVSEKRGKQRCSLG